MSATTYPATEAEDHDSILRTSASAMSNAAVDARASARAAAQSVKDGVGRGTYRAAFGLSFGVVFTGVFLTELLPVNSSLRRGLEDGAGDALDAVEARRLRAEEAADGTLDGGEDAGADDEPAVRTWSKNPAPRAPRPRRRED